MGLFGSIVCRFAFHTCLVYLLFQVHPLMTRCAYHLKRSIVLHEERHYRVMSRSFCFISHKRELSVTTPWSQSSMAISGSCYVVTTPWFNQESSIREELGKFLYSENFTNGIHNNRRSLDVWSSLTAVLIVTSFYNMVIHPLVDVVGILVDAKMSYIMSHIITNRLCLLKRA